MTGNPHSGDASDAPGDLDRVQEYRELVLEYERLDEEIDTLLARFGGATEKMPDEEFHHYRELAHHRDYIYSRLQELERQLFSDDSTP